MKNDTEQLTRYSAWRPTVFDTHGRGLPERQDWFVVPVIQTRDSNTLEESNFAAALQALGGESSLVEVHRFGHWGPGWFEIILVAPHAPQVSIAEDIDRALANYPVLDDMDYSERQLIRATEIWQHSSLSSRIQFCRRYDVSIFASRRDDLPQDPRGELVSYLGD